MSSGEPNWLLDTLRLLGRQAWRILLVFALVTGTALGWNALHGPAYTARLRLLVTPPSAGADHGETARNQAELLRDPGLLRRLVLSLRAPAGATHGAAADASWRGLATRLGLLSAPDQAARMARALAVRAVGDTDVIALDFTWSDPAFAADTLNALVAGYQRAVAGAAEAREAQRRAAARLADAQAERAALDARAAAQAAPAPAAAPAFPAAAAPSIAADGRSVTMPAAPAAAPAGDASALREDRARRETRLAGARAAADGVRLDRALARRRLDAVEQAYRGGGWVDAASTDENGTAAVPHEFSVLLEKRMALQAAGQADTAAMRALDREIARVREQNFATVRQIWTARIGGFDDRLGALAADIADDEAALRRLDAHVSEAEVLALARADRDARVAEARAALDAAAGRVDAAWQEVGTTRSLSEATPPGEPDPPSPALLVQLAAALGLALGLLAAVLAERRRRTIDRPEDISRRLGIDVLARLEDFSQAPSH